MGLACYPGSFITTNNKKFSQNALNFQWAMYFTAKCSFFKLKIYLTDFAKLQQRMNRWHKQRILFFNWKQNLCFRSRKHSFHTKNIVEDSKTFKTQNSKISSNFATVYVKQRIGSSCMNWRTQILSLMCFFYCFPLKIVNIKAKLSSFWKFVHVSYKNKAHALSF